MKYIYIIIILLLSACAQSTAVNKNAKYTADLTHIVNPTLTIKTTLEEQPPAFAYLATDIDVNEKSISMTLPGKAIGIPIPGLKDRKIFYYKHMGNPIITKSTDTPVWNVQIVDQYGNDFYWVYISTRNEAEKFVNALVYMIHNHK